MENFNSGPKSFDKSLGAPLPTTLDSKAEAARENSSSSFVLKEKKGDVTKFTNGLSGSDIPEKKLLYTKVSSEDIKKSGGIPTARHHYHDQCDGNAPDGKVFDSTNQPDRH